MDPIALPEMASSAEPIARRLVDWLRHAIVTMRIRPGEKLSEQDLARRFGVSRQPVREAFIKLAESGLVRVLPQRGTLVVKISVEAVADARFVREAIECAVVREAARRAVARALDDVRARLDDAARALAAGDQEHFFALDEEFHQRLAAAAGRPNSWSVVEEQKAQMDRVRYLDMSDAIPMKTVMAQHLAILAAVESGDVRAAEDAMRQHLSEILVSLPKIAARWPDLFEAGDTETAAPALAPTRPAGG